MEKETQKRRLAGDFIKTEQNRTSSLRDKTDLSLKHCLQFRQNTSEKLIFSRLIQFLQEAQLSQRGRVMLRVI